MNEPQERRGRPRSSLRLRRNADYIFFIFDKDLCGRWERRPLHQEGEEIGTGTVFDRLLSSSVPSYPDSPCEQCGDQSALNGVIESCLDCFLSGNDLYIFCYSVSLAFFISKVRGGTCTFASSDPAADVLHRARYLLRLGFGAYDLITNNCENFAVYIKTGLLVTTSYSVGRSGQWVCIVSAANAIAGSCLRFLSSSFGGLAVVTSGIYCLNRVVSDIGIRRDVTKFPIEEPVRRLVA